MRSSALIYNLPGRKVSKGSWLQISFECGVTTPYSRSPNAGRLQDRYLSLEGKDTWILWSSKAKCRSPAATASKGRRLDRGRLLQSKLAGSFEPCTCKLMAIKFTFCCRLSMSRRTNLPATSSVSLRNWRVDAFLSKDESRFLLRLVETQKQLKAACRALRFSGV